LQLYDGVPRKERNDFIRWERCEPRREGLDFGDYSGPAKDVEMRDAGDDVAMKSSALVGRKIRAGFILKVTSA
jgi:hypothetical protein